MKHYSFYTRKQGLKGETFILDETKVSWERVLTQANIIKSVTKESVAIVDNETKSIIKWV